MAQESLQFWCVPHYPQDQLAYVQRSLLVEHLSPLQQDPIQILLIPRMPLNVAVSIQKYLLDFELQDQHGVAHTLDPYRDNEFIVMYVQGVGCPIARIALPQYREVRDLYTDQNVEFLMSNATI